MYIVEIKRFNDLRAQYGDADTRDETWTSTGPTGQYRSGRIDLVLQRYMNEAVPSTWTLISLSRETDRVTIVWRDSTA